MIVDDIFNKKQVITSYTIEDLKNMYAEGNLKLREINKEQVRQIRRYIIDNVNEQMVYFPPIVAYKRENEDADTIHIIDGTQRMKAFIQLFDLYFQTIKSEDDAEVKNAVILWDMLKQTEIAMQIFEGITEKEANQMYVDFNTKGKKVALSKRIAFDSRDYINKITNSVLHDNTLLRIAGIEMEKRAVIRPTNKNFLSLSQLRQLVSLFLTGRLLNHYEKEYYDLSLQIDEYLSLIHTWFDALFELYPAERIGDYEESMLASFPLLIAVAMYALTNTEELPFQERKSLIISRMKKLKGVNWSRTNPIWLEFDGSIRGAYKYFYLNNNKRNIDQLTKWLQLQGR